MYKFNQHREDYYIPIMPRHRETHAKSRKGSNQFTSLRSLEFTTTYTQTSTFRANGSFLGRENLAATPISAIRSSKIDMTKPISQKAVLVHIPNTNSDSTSGNGKFRKMKQNQIPASEDKIMANQISRNTTGQSKPNNQSKQCNHFHQLNMTTPSKLKRRGGSARYFFFAFFIRLKNLG